MANLTWNNSWAPSLPDTEIEFLKLKEYYFVEENDFFMLGIALSEGVKENNQYMSSATYVSFYRSQNTGSFCKKSQWCYKHIGRKIRKATSKEIEWLDHCIEKDKFVPKDDFNNFKEKKFPDKGWCKDPSDKVFTYITKTFNEGKQCTRKGKMGIAWNGRSTWKIDNNSNYPVRNNKELEKFLPINKHVNLDISNLDFSGITGKLDWVSPIDTSYVGVNASRQGLLNDEAGQFEYPNYHAIELKKMEEHKRKHEQKMRDILFSNPDDCIASMNMAMITGLSGTTKKKNEFDQQDAVIMKTKEDDDRTLIFC